MLQQVINLFLALRSTSGLSSFIALCVKHFELSLRGRNLFAEISFMITEKLWLNTMYLESINQALPFPDARLSFEW